MNPVLRLRSHAGVTQKALAHQAGTSQPTIALYESGGKSPTLVTLQRLAASLDLELMITYAPKLTREDHRSLVYHNAIVQILKQDPASTIKRAKRTLAHMRRKHPEAASLFDRWRAWLKLPLEELSARILDPHMIAREMRHVTPFAGLLTAKDRARLLKQFRKEYRT